MNTKRLILRYFVMDDAEDLAKIANDPSIYATTLDIPNPYTLEDAKSFIGIHEKNRNEGIAFVFAITLKESGKLIGCMGLRVNKRHKKAEAGFWIGKEFWGQGYCKEAAEAVLNFGFSDLALNRIFAPHMVINQSSGKVLLKLGMKQEGYLREDGIPMDIIFYGILKREWEKNTSFKT